MNMNPAYDALEAEAFKAGYVDASKELTSVLEGIIEKNMGDDHKTVSEVMGLVLGNLAIFAGVSAEDAKLIKNMMSAF